VPILMESIGASSVDCRVDIFSERTRCNSPAE
jgi:hypothetical protein